MDTTLNDDDVMWRAVENDTLQNVGYVGVIVGRRSPRWCSGTARGSCSGDFWAAGTGPGPGGWPAAGLLMVVLLFGLGFITDRWRVVLDVAVQ